MINVKVSRFFTLLDVSKVNTHIHSLITNSPVIYKTEKKTCSISDNSGGSSPLSSPVRKGRFAVTRIEESVDTPTAPLPSSSASSTPRDSLTNEESSRNAPTAVSESLDGDVQVRDKFLFYLLSF